MQISLVEGSLFKSSLSTEVMLYGVENIGNTGKESLYHIPKYSTRSSRTAVKKSRISLEKNKFTLYFSETLHPSIVVNFRTYFIV